MPQFGFFFAVIAGNRTNGAKGEEKRPREAQFRRRWGLLTEISRACRRTFEVYRSLTHVSKCLKQFLVRHVPLNRLH